MLLMEYEVCVEAMQIFLPAGRLRTYLFRKRDGCVPYMMRARWLRFQGATPTMSMSRWQRNKQDKHG